MAAWFIEFLSCDEVLLSSGRRSSYGFDIKSRLRERTACEQQATGANVEVLTISPILPVVYHQFTTGRCWFAGPVFGYEVAADSCLQSEAIEFDLIPEDEADFRGYLVIC